MFGEYHIFDVYTNVYFPTVTVHHYCDFYTIMRIILRKHVLFSLIMKTVQIRENTHIASIVRLRTSVLRIITQDVLTRHFLLTFVK